MRFNLAIFVLISLTLAGETLTQGERSRAMSELHASRKIVIDAAYGLTEKQLNWKAGADRWSIAEVIEHLAITEPFLFNLYKQVSTAPASPAAKAAQKDEDFLKSIRSRDQKVKAPDQATPKKTFTNTAAALAAFKERRDSTITYVETNQDHDLRLKIVPGMQMDAYQVFLLLAAHAQRHTDQINEVKASPGYPKK